MSTHSPLPSIVTFTFSIILVSGTEAYIREAAYRALDGETMEMLRRPWITNEEGRKGFVRQIVQANSRSAEDIEERYYEVGQKMPVSKKCGNEDN